MAEEPQPPPQPTPAEQAGYHGETKESGSDPNRGDKHWDPAWERRARKLLGSENVGDLGDLYDPKHRQWLNRQMRKAKAAKQGATSPAAAPVEEAAAVEQETPETEAAGAKPVAQGGREQWEGIQAGTQLEGLFPERRVPGDNMDEGRVVGPSESTVEAGSGEQWGQLQPGGGGDIREPVLKAGELWQGGTQSAPTREAGFYQTGTEQLGREDVTAGRQEAALAQPGSSNVRLPSQPWPPPSRRPTWYTGGM